MREATVDAQFPTPLRRRARPALVPEPRPQAVSAEPEARRRVRKLQVRQAALERQIAELRMANSGLEAAHAAFMDVFEFAPVAYLILDREYLVREANICAATLLGIPREKLRGSNFADLLGDASRRGLADAFATLGLTGRLHNLQWEAKSGDGRLLPVLVNAVMLRGAHGEVTSTRWVLTDIGAEQGLAEERAAHARRMEEVSHRLIDVQESERLRFSAELNDVISSSLATIQVGLKGLADDLPRKSYRACAVQFEDIAAHINDAAATAREVCSELRPPVLDYAGLPAALRAYASRFARHTGIEVRIKGDGSRRRPRSEIESALFRVAQEALLNCAKHSRAATVEVALSMRKNRIALSIADDGVGFSVHVAGSGSGLSVMRDRAEFVGGRFSVDTRLGRGTKIKVAIEGSDGLYG